MFRAPVTTESSTHVPMPICVHRFRLRTGCTQIGEHGFHVSLAASGSEPEALLGGENSKSRLVSPWALLLQPMKFCCSIMGPTLQPWTFGCARKNLATSRLQRIPRNFEKISLVSTINAAACFLSLASQSSRSKFPLH
uniref:Uncharacterized protein n=1 Tax=Nelumbo nucifera TaxID=4432 RepID=A0A822ZJA1_NELNU|nr:TPA_asm: hypothetical protein HUJ06_003442 [Nelumbo nucifera]